MSKTVYAWREGGRCPVKPEGAGRELERIAAESDGELRPPEVVEASRPEDAPLHPCFTWDDREAAELYRHVEARQIIRAIVIEPATDDERPRYQYVSIVPASNERAYMDTAVVMSDAALREQALSDAMAGINAWRKRWEHLSELADLFAAIDRALAAPPQKAKRKRAGKRVAAQPA